MMRFRRRWFWLGLIVLILVGLARLRFDVEILNLLPDDVPAVKALKLYNQHFTNARELIISVRGPSPDTTETAARDLALRLRALPQLVGDVTWQPPWLEQPGGAAELAAHIWLNQPPEVFRQLADRLAPANAAATLADAREQLATSFSPGEIARLAYDPFGLLNLPTKEGGAGDSFNDGQEFFSSTDGTFRLVFVQARTDLATYRECASWLATIKQSIGAPPDGVSLAFTGRPAFVAEIAGGMERDIIGSVLGTTVIIAGLFWWAHRRWRPLLWLVALLGLILAGTTALGGLIFGAINVVSLGFAAILLGLAVDYGLVLYQEAQSSPGLSADQLRREHTAGIFWSAVTTAGAFLLLNLGGLPGLAQLGSLVAIGIALATVVMLFLFLPPLLRSRSLIAPDHSAQAVQPVKAINHAARRKLARGVTLVVALFIAGVLVRARPAFDHSPNALRPLHSAAYAALDEIKARMQREQEPMWVVVNGRDEAEVARRLAAVQPALERGIADGVLQSFTLPTSFWPQPERQRANREAALDVVRSRESLRSATVAAGFSTNAFSVTTSVLDHWERIATSDTVLWPSNAVSRWVTGKLSARTTNEAFALGLVHLPAGGVKFERLSAQATTLPEGARLAGWETIGEALLQAVEDKLRLVAVLMFALLLGSLWLAFHRVSEVMLSLATLGFSFLALLALMTLAGWSWNLLNLMALPLLLGSGVDYSIHMQLALRRHGGDIAAARRSTGRALFLCGATTIAGFGSLAWSSNAGMASLGKVCAAGLACTMTTAIWLLPAWWRAVGQNPKTNISNPSAPADAPSRLYAGMLWRGALLVTRMLPASLMTTLSRLGANLYSRCAAGRRAIVEANLLPVLGGDRVAAEQTATALFDQFGRKLADLWRYESGRPVDQLFGELTGFEHFLAAQTAGRGVLLLTPHLGNWEFGAPLLARRGVKLLVITLAEPGRGFTEMRQAARERWGIETLVIGEDPFAFVEVIKRLAAGATVALLVDRPPAASAVEVELFGHPFLASIAPAELARASGAALLPVVLPRVGHGYAAHILPEIAYDRRALGTREARQELTRQILRAFEPALRQHPDQWFHFVPVWSRP